MSERVEALKSRCTVRLEPQGVTIEVPGGTLLHDALEQAGISIPLPCGGQGRCGRCLVIVTEGTVRRRSSLRLSAEDILRGYALACQTVITGNVTVHVPPPEQVIEHVPGVARADKAALQMEHCEHDSEPWVGAYRVRITPPTLQDNVSDMARVARDLSRQHCISKVTPTLRSLRQLPGALRKKPWDVTALIERCDLDSTARPSRLLDVWPSDDRPEALHGLAIDIGTTTVAIYLVNLGTREVLDHATAYNSQIDCGEDVISRIIYARQPGHLAELQRHVIATINALIDEMLTRQSFPPESVVRATVAGNTTMLQLYLAIEPQYIRLEPYVPVARHFAPLRASELGLHMHPEGLVDCLPVVGAYVGADITAGVLRSRMSEEESLSLFIDIGTNGEMVLGNRDWLIACACSAGPAFEGSGATSGTRAVRGAIEEVWIDPRTLEPTWHTIGGAPPVGICGSGMVSLIGEMVITRVIDRGGHVKPHRSSNRIREGEGGMEYVVTRAENAGVRRDIVLTETDIQNVLRAKAAIYAGMTVLADSVGLSMADVQRIIIGGGFGQHLDVEKAIQIGLLPDMPWERFLYLGNTSVQGAYLALTCRQHRAMVDALAEKMTYLELSADNRFMDAFTSALFLPHTDETLFPSVHQTQGAANDAGERT